jgi:hypothetical protein
MRQGLYVIAEGIRREPFAIVGFLLLGAFSVLFAHIQFKMRDAGYNTNPLASRPRDWKLPAEYLRIRDQHRWSPWPAYLIWPALVLGIVSLVFGLFHL